MEQRAKILVNGELTESINIFRGTHQGCPLLPLLFITTWKILNKSIRENKEIKGLRIRGQEYKLLAFADDLAIVLEDPLQSFTAFKRELDLYAEVARMRINLDKTKMISKNLTQQQNKIK